MKSCHNRNIDLLRYLDNDLSEQERKLCWAHLETCADCQRRLEQERVLTQFLSQSRPLYAAPAELRSRVSTIIEQHSSADRAQWRWWRRAAPLIFSWKTAVLAALVIALCVLVAPNVVQKVRAASYAEAAIANHNRYLNHELRAGIHTSSPEAVAAWFAGKVPFQFRLPTSEAVLDATPAYKLVGASLVDYRGTTAAMIHYEAPSGIISLMIDSSNAAVVAGGEEIHKGTLTFHYRNEGRLKVITWRAHNLSYALVSSIAGPAQDSCMVCHQSMGDHGQFRAKP
jgi:anti-sigma factor RsiW